MDDFKNMLDQYAMLDYLSEKPLHNNNDSISELHSKLFHKQPETIPKPTTVNPYTSRIEMSVPEVDIISEYMPREARESIQATLDRYIHLSLAGFTIAAESDTYTFAREATESSGAFTVEDMEELMKKFTPLPKIEAAPEAKKMLSRQLLKQAGIDYCSPDMEVEMLCGVKVKVNHYLPRDTVVVINYDPDTKKPIVQLFKFDNLGEANGST